MQQRQDQLIEYTTIQSQRDEVFSLSGEQVNSFHVGHRGLNIRLVEGRAWVSYDNHDVIVESGEKIYIPGSKYRVIISSVSKQGAIRYQIA